MCVGNSNKCKFVLIKFCKKKKIYIKIGSRRTIGSGEKKETALSNGFTFWHISAHPVLTHKSLRYLILIWVGNNFRIVVFTI